MKHSIKVGFSFGLASGIVTTLGLMVGLNSSTNSKLAVVGGILTIAIADALSDAMGIHVTEEVQNKYSEKEIWESTFTTFLFSLLLARERNANPSKVIAEHLLITGFVVIGAHYIGQTISLFFG